MAKGHKTIPFHPVRGHVLYCNFDGYIIPEMIKCRPVVVLVGRLPYRDRLVTIVPISTTPPEHPQAFHVKLTRNPIPENEGVDAWVKCDMVAVVSIERLDRIKVKRKAYEQRSYITPKLCAEDMAAITKGVRAGLNLSVDEDS